VHINFTVFEITRGHDIVRAERECYKREDIPSNASPNNEEK
jgi:hypothetical protein